MQFRALYVLPLLVACGGYMPTYLGPFEESEAAILPPLACAGADREILWGYPTRLDATGSYHPAGRVFTVRWQQLEGEPLHLSNASSPTPTFVAPLTEQTLRFALVADDGTYSTSDEVRLHVRKEPLASAPRVRVEADRLLGYGEAAVPRESDVLEATDGAELAWNLVVPAPSTQLPEVAPQADGSVTVHRLIASKDGLESAPDHLLLHAFDAEQHGQRAPIAALQAPGTVVPGETFSLDATASTDPNGDRLAFRWELMSGDGSLDSGTGGRVRELTATATPQEIVVRLFVADQLLESAPAVASIVVTAPDIAAPAVNPPFEVRAHPGNTVRLDARPESAYSTASPAFEWQQTSGQPVALTLTEAGRLASFTAAEVGVLGMAVRASIDSTALTVFGEPAVSRVEVVPFEDNLPPLIYLCASTTAPAPGQSVVITGRIDDPESDARGSLAWSQINASDRVTLAERTGPSVGTPLCDTSGTLETSQVELVAPDLPGASLTVRLEACDTLGACSSLDVVLTVN